MKRAELAPPRPIPPVALDTATETWPERDGIPFPAGPRVRPGRPILGAEPADPPVWRGRLGEAATAKERRRHLFHPRRGWFRRLERSASHYLSSNVYPWIPGISLPYGRVLRHELCLSEAEVELRGLPAAFDGLTALLISDIHAGPFLSPTVLRSAFERLLVLRPDVVFLGGDLITANVDEFERSLEAFAALRAPLGVFAVLGNHDYYSGEQDRLCRLLHGLGIHLLHNASVQLERRGGSLSLAGVDDLLMGAPDMPAALRGTRAPVVLLSHNPDLLFEARRRGVSLMLSGHTHAGQVRVPGLPVLVRQSRFRLDSGRYRTGETELIVSRGLGAVGLPIRWGCPPEAVLLTLRRSRA